MSNSSRITYCLTKDWMRVFDVRGKTVDLPILSHLVLEETITGFPPEICATMGAAEALQWRR